jgi:hypothetical protein
VRLAALLAALAGSLALAGGTAAASGRSTTKPTARWETREELSWLQHFGRWRTTVLESFRAQSFENCGPSLVARVGSPPTQRLLAGFHAVEHACDAFARIVSQRSFDRAWRRFEAGGSLLRVVERLRLPTGGARRDAHRTSYRDPPMTRVASTIADKRVQVRCWSPADWSRLYDEQNAYYDGRVRSRETEAYANVGGSSIEISALRCEGFENLHKFTDADLRATPYAWASSFDILAHEAEHARGVANEAKAECFAMQLIPRTARAFGYSAQTGRFLARAYWLHYGEEPPGYHSVRCREGGPYDLNRDSSVWP